MFLYNSFGFVFRALQLPDVFCPVPISVLGMPQKGESARHEAFLKGNKRYFKTSKIYKNEAVNEKTKNLYTIHDFVSEE